MTAEETEEQANDVAREIARQFQRGNRRVLLIGTYPKPVSTIVLRIKNHMAPLAVSEEQEITSFYSHARMGWAPANGRPLRIPHYSASEAGMLGTLHHPGEATLALHGILFLQDTTEFSRSMLRKLDAALRSGESRVGGAIWPVETFVVGSVIRRPGRNLGQLHFAFDTVIDLDKFRYSSGPKPDFFARRKKFMSFGSW